MNKVVAMTPLQTLPFQFCNQFRGGSRTAATSKMERFVIIVNSFLSLTIITKRSIMDVAEVLDPMSLAKFNNFCQRFLKRANSQIINFLEKSCNNLSVKRETYKRGQNSSNKYRIVVRFAMIQMCSQCNLNSF